MYTSPHDACTLIKAWTLATYAPGATVDLIPLPNVGGLPQLSDCGWGAQNGSLSLFVTIYVDADGALGGYQTALQTGHQNPNGNTFDGARPVKGLGDQATAIFETSLGNPEVDLYVVSGNADIEMSFTDVLFSPTLSRAGKLAADVAMARDVLADLPR